MDLFILETNRIYHNTQAIGYSTENNRKQSFLFVSNSNILSYILNILLYLAILSIQFQFYVKQRKKWLSGRLHWSPIKIESYLKFKFRYILRRFLLQQKDEKKHSSRHFPRWSTVKFIQANVITTSNKSKQFVLIQVHK